MLLCYLIFRDVECGDVVLTQVALSHSGRMLFVGTSNGTLRSMKFPLNTPGEWQEHQVSAVQWSNVRSGDPNCHMLMTLLMEAG